MNESVMLCTRVLYGQSDRDLSDLFAHWAVCQIAVCVTGVDTIWSVSMRQLCEITMAMFLASPNVALNRYRVTV